MCVHRLASFHKSKVKSLLLSKYSFLLLLLLPRQAAPAAPVVAVSIHNCYSYRATTGDERRCVRLALSVLDVLLCEVTSGRRLTWLERISLGGAFQGLRHVALFVSCSTCSKVHTLHSQRVSRNLRVRVHWLLSHTQTNNTNNHKTPGLAAAAEPYVTSLIYCHDPVPRLTPAAVQQLRVELLKVDWAAQLKSSLLEAEYTQVGCYLLFQDVSSCYNHVITTL